MPGRFSSSVITISIGVATFQDHAAPERPPNEQKNQILKQADAALYMAKLAGKNCVVAAPSVALGTVSATVILKS